MENQYHEYKQILKEKLEALGFTTQPEDTAGLGRSLAFVKDGFQVHLVYDLRDKLVTLQASNDGKLAGRAYFYDAASIKKDFFVKLNEILAPQGLQVEIPAAVAKSGGFLSKLFGKK
jgi:hypothetical protein